MATNPAKRQVPKSKSSVIQWLLDSDPSIRWQAMRDLTDAPAEEVAAERARVATEGAGARLLALQGPDGRWGGAAWNRGWDSTMHVLSLLWDMGLDPASDQARRAVGLVRDRVTWRGCGPEEVGRQPLLRRRGRAVHQRTGGGDRRLLRPGRPGHRRPAARRAAGRRRLELRGRERLDAVVVQHHDLRARGPARIRTAGGSSPAVTAARLRGQEYLLERRLFRRQSTGEVIDQAPGRASPSRPGGTTTCCGGSSTCAAPASRPTSAWPRRSSWSRRSATATAGGRSRPSTPARCRSRWTRARAGRAGGTPSAPYGCWTGIQHETNADAAGRRPATMQTSAFSHSL